MFQKVKVGVRNLLKKLPIPLSKNHLYDLQTKSIMKRSLRADSNGIDVGCHDGEIMDLMLKFAPGGQHYGFEPIPSFADFLFKKYRRQNQVHIFPTALGEKQGSTKFTFVKSNPAYSGILQRKFDRKNEETEEIDVEIKKLDDCIPTDLKIDFIKIDVEGAELLVLQGGRSLIERCKPLVVFEHGLGAADIYGYGPEEIFEYFSPIGMQIYTLGAYLHKQQALSLAEFKQVFVKGSHYYFVASV